MAATIERTATPIAQVERVERVEPVQGRSMQVVVGLLRIALGWTFLWAFLDKAFALGFSTGRLEDGTIDKTAAWFQGGSPTKGVFAYALNAGWFTGFYETLGRVEMTAQGPVANPPAWIDAAYMVSMVLIGLGLITGVMTRLAAVGGIAWLLIFYTATAILPEHNPLTDDHLIYTVVLVGLILANAGRYVGLGKAWQRIGFVQKHPSLY